MTCSFFQLKRIIILVTLVSVFGCRKLSDQEVLRQALEINNTNQRITALKQFIQDYPQSKSVNRAYQTIFRDEVALGNGQEAVKAATEYLSFLPPNARMLDYNSMAWTLAENGLALDSARIYAERAVRLARETNSRRLHLILDTYAYALYKSGDAAAAELNQQEAIIGNEDDGGFLSRLAEYQHANKKRLVALNTMARAILYNAESAVIHFFNDWLVEEEPQVNSRQSLARKIVEQTVTDFLKENDTAVGRSQAAMLLVKTGTDIDRAEKWAAAAVAALDPNASPDEQIMLNKNLALVYGAKNDYAKMIQILEPWKSLAVPYDQEYWIALAQAYYKGGQREKSFQAILNGSVLGQTEELQAIARNQDYSESQVDSAVEKYQQELKAFDPGKAEMNQQVTIQVVLVELFTGAECNPCAGADRALDLLTEFYPRQIVALVEYHLHIPGADPLTNTSTEARYDFYGSDFGTPTVIFNGALRYSGGGPDLVKKALFSRYRQAAEKYFAPAARMTLSLTTGYQKNLIDIKVEVNSTTEKVKDPVDLYTALVEKSVDYTGGNGISKHAYVVRYLVNKGEGIPVKLKNGKSVITEKIDLYEVQNGITKYLDNFTQHPPERFKNFPGWNIRPEKLNIDNLAVVVWIQDEDSKKVYQAMYQDLK